MKLYQNDYQTYKNPKNLEQIKLKVYSYMLNGLLYENKSDITKQKKYYDYFLNNLILDNPNNIIELKTKSYYHRHFILNFIVARIYYYGLSSKGKNIKKAKKILPIASDKYNIIKRTKFWKDEYNKINNHKL